MLYQLSYASQQCCSAGWLSRAGDGARTRDIKLGRLALYQLSYSRETSIPSPAFFSPNGGGRIRTFEGVSRQIYSLLPLATWVPHRIRRTRPRRATRKKRLRHATKLEVRADGGNRTHDLPLTRRLLCHLSYVSDSRSFL